MNTNRWGSILMVTTLGLGVAALAPEALAESAPAKASKTAAAKGEEAKPDKAPAKEDDPKRGPQESKPETQQAPAPTAQPSHEADEHLERKVSPFGSPSPVPQDPQAAEEPYPPSARAYPPPGPPPWYAYPPSGHPCPALGYPLYDDYPPPGHPMGEVRPHCRCCPHRGCAGSALLEQRAGYHAHDGFFLRLGLGGGYARTAISTPHGKLTHSGTSLPANLAIGAAIRPNLILFGELVSHQINRPTTKFAGESKTARSMDLAIQGVGPGLAYYFMPINIYVSGSILFHSIHIARDADSSEYTSNELSTVGFAANLMAGKEWWITRDWGIGLAAHFMVGTAKNRAYYDRMNTGDSANDGFVEDRWNSVAFGLLMSATYN